MNFEEMTDLMQNSGITVRKYCGIPVDEMNMCANEAEGELTVEIEDGITIPVPICKPHLDVITSHYDVENV